MMFMRRCLLRRRANHNGSVVRVGGTSGFVGPYMVTSSCQFCRFSRTRLKRKREYSAAYLGEFRVNVLLVSRVVRAADEAQ